MSFKKADSDNSKLKATTFFQLTLSYVLCKNIDWSEIIKYVKHILYRKPSFTKDIYRWRQKHGRKSKVARQIFFRILDSSITL